MEVDLAPVDCFHCSLTAGVPVNKQVPTTSLLCALQNLECTIEPNCNHRVYDYEYT